MIPESQELEKLLVECVIPGLAELTAKQLPYGDKLQVFAGSRLCGNQYVLITLLKLQCLRHVSPLGAGVKLSVVQTDQVIIALPGDKCKMSIYDKTPPERGLISTGGFAFCGGFRHAHAPSGAGLHY